MDSLKDLGPTLRRNSCRRSKDASWNCSGSTCTQTPAQCIQFRVCLSYKWPVSLIQL